MSTALKPYDFEVAEIRSLGLQLVEQADALVITDDETDAAAKTVLATVTKALKRAEDRRVELKAPALAECKAIDSAFGEATEPFKQAKASIATKTGEYFKAKKEAEETARREQERREREELAARMKAEAEAAAKGEQAPEPSKPAPVPEPASQAPAVVQTDAGTVGMVRHRGFRVVDEAQIPRAYWILDEKRIAAAYKAGGDVPGCVEEISYTPRTR